MDTSAVSHQLRAVRQEVDVEHVRGLHVHHQVPGGVERGLARVAVQPLVVAAAAAAAAAVVVAP